MTESQQPAHSARFRRSLLVVLVVLLVASVGFLAYVLATRTTGDNDDREADRSAAQSQARQFMLRLNVYGPDLLDDKGQMPKYRESVSELLTAKFKASFLESVTFAEQTVVAGAARTGEVYATGATSVDDDSATVLVAGSFTGTYQGEGAAEPVSADPQAYRVIVTLVKTQGKWLVDLYEPEPEADEPTSIPTISPSTPTSAPTPTPPAGDPTSQPSQTTLGPLPQPTAGGTG